MEKRLAADVLGYCLTEKAQTLGLAFRVPERLDAGFDIACMHSLSIAPGLSACISTGLHLAVPDGWVGLIRDRSSVALRGGVTAAGVIDASYRGEVRVLMFNLGTADLDFTCGDRIAQCIVVPCLPGKQSLEVASVDLLGTTERGTAGFGSTGR